MQRLKMVLVPAVMLCLAGAVGLRAQVEHPQEHPKKGNAATKPISTATLENAIKSQIEEKAKANNGKFPVRDDVLDKTWQLQLVRVHTDKLTQLDEQTYFACVDFKADDGTLVDVDFYMKKDNDKLSLTDTTVHKINGKPRFNYVKKGNYWERVKVGS